MGAAKSDHSSTVSSASELEMISLSGPTAEYDGMRIGIRQSGRGDADAIVCMHGIGSNSLGYSAQLASLSASHHVVAWDAPGYMSSDALPWLEPRPESYADALAGLAVALKLGPMVVVGSSFGAVIAAAFAARYPARVRGVVLSAPAPGFARAPIEKRLEAINKRLGDMARLGPAGVARERSHVLVAPDSSKEIVAAAAALVASTRPEGYAQATHAIDMADTVSVAGEIEAPTLVLVGAEDNVTPADTGAKPIHANLKNGRLEILKGVGHLIKLEAPERFNALVLDFVKGLPPMT